MRLFKRGKKKEELQDGKRSHITDGKGEIENNEVLSQLTIDELSRLDLEKPEGLSDSTTETLEETSENINTTKGNKKKKKISGISMKKDE
jgi:hypothetical protein